MAFFHSPEKKEIHFPPGLQFRRDEAAEAVKFAFGAGLHQLMTQEALVNPVPPLQLAQGVPE